jgi:branched-chain amino acid transport system ATP-binding protein
MQAEPRAPLAGGIAPGAPDGVILQITDLSAGYGDIVVLRDVSLEVRKGEVLAVIGTNGAGKSTLLRTVSGLLPAKSGSIRMDGRELTAMSASEIVGHGIAHAPEGRRVFSGFTVEENLRLGAFRRGDKSRAALAAAVDRVFDYFPRLKERRRQLAGTMSGGEQQMCAIGRALMADPRLLVIDELSLGLAPRVVEELLNILARIHEAGTTIILVEQDVAVALGFSDRAVVLQAGSVVLTGDAEELLVNSDMVKTYLGG